MSEPSIASIAAQTVILVVAAGRGSRAGEGLPKQYRPLAGRPLMAHTFSTLAAGAPGARLLPVIHPDDTALLTTACSSLPKEVRRTLLAPVSGGATRQQSARAGLEACDRLTPRPRYVLIHDCARPFSPPALLQTALRSAVAYGAAVPGVAVTDTIKEIDTSGLIVSTPPRSGLRAVQTPQAFAFDLILAAHRRAAEAGLTEMSDDAAVAEWAGHPVHVFEGDRTNMKITSAEDIAAAEARIFASLPDVRTGQGFDVHALGHGDHVWLGGIRIPHTHGLIGHSDADVLMHAVTDALYGALADGDIGSHFPPSDPQWKGAASEIFLQHAAEQVRKRGGMIAHVDGTVVCELPKVGPHRDSIRTRLAEIMGIEPSRVAVKATTSEQLGFTGRGEGIAALALATIRLP